MANKEQTEDIIKRQTYLVRFGGGLGKRLNELLDNESLYQAIFKNKTITKALKELKTGLKRQRKTFDKQLIKELSGLVKIEKEWLKVHGIGGISGTINELVHAGLNVELVDTFASDGSKQTPQKMIDGAWGRRATQLEDVSRSFIYESMAVTDTLTALKAIEKQFTRNIETSALTSTLAITNNMREQVYLQNPNVVRGVLMSAVLDGRTTQFCKQIDGKIYPNGVGPRPPFHPRCRTIPLPVFVNETDKEAREVLEFRPQVKAGENYQKKGVKGKKNLKKNRETGQIKTLPSGKDRSSGSSYSHFLSSQTGTKGGRIFIKDALGKANGEKFIKLVNDGVSPPEALKRAVPGVDKRILSLGGLKKRTRPNN